MRQLQEKIRRGGRRGHKQQKTKKADTKEENPVKRDSKKKAKHRLR